MTPRLYQLSTDTIEFPSPTLALNEPDGLLAIGGCLSPTRLNLAYKSGIFPWFNEKEPIMWWSPSERGVIDLQDFHISRSLKKAARKEKPIVTVNKDFETVINACRMQRLDAEGTWINSQMLSAYTVLHKLGFAHSLEVWDQNNTLMGGLYGVMNSGVFCGESMFFNRPNGSKLAMWALVNWLKKHDAHFVDCQLENPYLTSLGAKLISRSEFLAKLRIAQRFEIPISMWKPQVLEDIYD
ncbi:leucyl/phenylalanyl-tRNA--protein transferase [Pseudoalteromonas phenolica]|uniref:Leucyl/phenylalanyl-tRNA--protein transferase n=1 Tax=Pseudoalteromonas phenolica TaxID=161398 RepID=A0A0S2K1Q1_9GAMM|nr:leucyl/phenylalanyl-tRNA--protein transferase [Pseudoalteromonas phenolica]ALO41999.1 Leucyl/phenylalanyl-tRNA--protein transferase [Pseudoalteromonas phenolica]MBE0353439.1 leucyl/phenylalanyl-tRNA--protein transferase [Pseudoalteromonas phenolica O-BC30]TMO55264.1 leucyl/phenylalanyl-tRNA--protein transferase [Pseudoalteromonas phenolica]